jgi:hypothetical protein
LAQCGFKQHRLFHNAFTSRSDSSWIRFNCSCC